MAVWGNNDHWTAPHFDNYGFRRSELKILADKLGVDLNTSIEEIVGAAKKNEKYVPAHEDINNLKNEIYELKKQIDKLENQRPLLLGVYRDDDPLLLAITIRNKEWTKYDPDNDRATRGNQASIISELQSRGFTSRQAESIELVACPIKR